jgi:flagellar hook assembly protein FlgD
MEVLDAAGRIIRSLESGATTWDGRDATGRPVGAGTYWLRASGDVSQSPARVIYLR